MSKILIAFIPPPVEPAQAPMTLNISRKIGKNEGQAEKSSLSYPVVVAIDTVWNRP